MTDYNYAEIDPDQSKPPEEWHYSHRRAWILEHKILALGSVQSVNWTELADRFDKSKSTLHNDKQRLVEYLGEEVEEERVRARGRALFETVLRDTIAQYNDPADDSMTAERVVNVYRKWVQTLREFGQLPPPADDPRHTRGDASEVPEEIQVGLSGVEADRYNPEEADLELPEQDRPDGEDSPEAETEVET